jgi:DNA gyrase subunit A
LIKEELSLIKEKYGDERRSEIVYAAEDFRIEDMIPNEEVVVTISHLGYIKRTSLSEYRTQSRGGVGSKGTATRNEDFLESLFVASTHNYLLIFTAKGKCFWMRVFEVPEGTKSSKGRAIQNLLNIEPDDKVITYINVESLSDEELLNSHHIVMCTKNGVIKKTSLEAYSRPRTNGIIAIGVREGDHLLEAKLTNGDNHIIMALRSGKAIHFHESAVRSMGRGASGVRGVTLAHDKDEVVGMICVNNPQETALVVSEKGYGKRTVVEDYRITNRGGKGVKTLNVTEKTGELIAIKNVTDDDDLMIINKSGIIIRLSVEELRVMGRATQGVKLINLRKNDEIAAVAKVTAFEEEEELSEEGEESTSETSESDETAEGNDATENSEPTEE